MGYPIEPHDIQALRVFFISPKNRKVAKQPPSEGFGAVMWLMMGGDVGDLWSGAIARELGRRSDGARMDKPCGNGFIANKFKCGKNLSSGLHQKLIDAGQNVFKPYEKKMDAAQRDYKALESSIDRLKAGNGDIEALKEQWKEAKAKATQSMMPVEKIRDSLMRKSAVTEEEIDSFFSSLRITRNAKTTMKESELDEVGFSEAIEEAYRLSNGKLRPNLKVDSDDIGLASAAIDLRSRTMYVSDRLNREDVYHELGHLLEEDSPKVKDAAYEFLLARADSNKVSLSQFTGVKGHKNEKIYPDKFVDPYVGKVYSNKETEIISVGLQHFADSNSMVHLYAKDKEHFYLTLGALNANL